MPNNKRNLAKAIYETVETVLREDLSIILNGASVGDVIDVDTIYDVARCTEESYNDSRNKYPHAITSIKCFAIQSFWLAKLKPINGKNLQTAKGIISLAEINELVALIILFRGLYKQIHDGKAQEIFGNSTNGLASFQQLTIKYFTVPVYIDTHGKAVKKSQKFRETIHHMRYKHVTAVNLYEMIVHSLLPLQS